MKTVLQFSDDSTIEFSDLQLKEMRAYFLGIRKTYVAPVKDIKLFKEKVLHDLRSSSLTEGKIINKHRNHRELIIAAIDELIEEGLIGCNLINKNGNNKTHRELFLNNT